MKSVYQTSINIAAGCAIGYAQTGDVTTALPGTLKSVELNGLPDLSEISAGRKITTSIGPGCARSRVLRTGRCLRKAKDKKL
jgi:hypothetical protein